MVLVAFVQPVLALDVGQIVVGLIAMVMVIVRQLLEANKNAGVKRAQQPLPQPPQPQNPNKAPAAGAGQQAEPLRAQVENLLRRAGRPAEQNPPRPQPAPASQIEMLV